MAEHFMMWAIFGTGHNMDTVILIDMSILGDEITMFAPQYNLKLYNRR